MGAEGFAKHGQTKRAHVLDEGRHVVSLRWTLHCRVTYLCAHAFLFWPWTVEKVHASRDLNRSRSVPTGLESRMAAK